MSSILSSQGVVLATAMAVSSTVLYLAFSKQKALTDLISKNHDDSQSPNQKLRSCLYSEEKKRERKKKKKVQFAENVRDTKGNGEEYRREKENALFAKHKEEMNSRRRRNIERNCRNEIPDQIHGMPANRVALYNGILRDRVHRMECSH